MVDSLQPWLVDARRAFCFVPAFMQSILGTPPLVASLALFPAILCSRIVPPVAGRVYDRRGPDVLLPPSCLSPVLPPYATAAENYSSLTVF